MVRAKYGRPGIYRHWADVQSMHPQIFKGFQQYKRAQQFLMRASERFLDADEMRALNLWDKKGIQSPPRPVNESIDNMHAMGAAEAPTTDPNMSRKRELEAARSLQVGTPKVQTTPTKVQTKPSKVQTSGPNVQPQVQTVQTAKTQRNKDVHHASKRTSRSMGGKQRKIKQKSRFTGYYATNNRVPPDYFTNPKWSREPRLYPRNKAFKPTTNAPTTTQHPYHLTLDDSICTKEDLHTILNELDKISMEQDVHEQEINKDVAEMFYTSFQAHQREQLIRHTGRGARHGREEPKTPAGHDTTSLGGRANDFQVTVVVHQHPHGPCPNDPQRHERWEVTCPDRINTRTILPFIRQSLHCGSRQAMTHHLT